MLKNIYGKIILAIVLLIALGALTLVFLPMRGGSSSRLLLGSPEGAKHTVNFDDKSGYVPSEIKIKKGDTVIFKNNSGKHFWPASDIHPTHGIYPEFDPQDAVAPYKSWSFKFEKTGTWRFHDHLAPYFTGRIITE